MPSDSNPVALVTGGSAGLGLVISRKLLSAGYQVVVMGRDQARLDTACADLGSGATSIQCDVTHIEQVATAIGNLPQLNVLINCVGASDRGLIEDLDPIRMQELIDQNVRSALICSQAALPLLKRSRGSVINIGSLAAKVGARYIGGYSIAKHALAGMTQQMRLELMPSGVHVGLVSPGPIRRADAGDRYRVAVNHKLPAQAAAPGGGTKVKGLDPERVADAVLRTIQKRLPDVVLPGYLRVLISFGHAFPRLGDWLLLKLTS